MMASTAMAPCLFLANFILFTLERVGHCGLNKATPIDEAIDFGSSFKYWGILQILVISCQELLSRKFGVEIPFAKATIRIWRIRWTIEKINSCIIKSISSFSQKHFICFVRYSLHHLKRTSFISWNHSSKWLITAIKRRWLVLLL